MIELYGHPFSSFTWKVLIAAYERDVPFAFRMLSPEHPDNAARLNELSPTGQFPALVDPGSGVGAGGQREVTGSNAVIAYLDRIGGAPPLIPVGDPGDRARELADVFDDYVHVPMQRIVAEHFRGEGEHDPTGVAEAGRKLDRSYAWLAKSVGAGWATGGDFSIADCAAAPALFYADWVHPIPDGALKDYRARLLAHASVARAIDEARPYRSYFPPGAPDRD